jgi:transposase InsO family protein
MQVFGLPGHVIRTGKVASRIAAKSSDNEAAIRRATVARWRQAMADGLSAEQAARAVGVARATLYRWLERAEPRSRRPRRVRTRNWTPALVEAVEHLRGDNPMWGKRKLAVLLRREGLAVSISTVGRIIAHLVARGAIVAVPILRRRPGQRRWRRPGHRHAKRLPKGLKPDKPGALVQIDTLFVNVRPDRAIKHFTAYDPVAKWTVGSVATRTTAQCARALLDKLIAEAPFKIEGIQVDGGSEFRADFEMACQQKGLTLFVLPPKRPQLNGAVERAQASWRYEFYACHDLPSRIEKLQPLVDAFAHRFNHYRPHDALDGQTPAEYLKISSTATPQSHIC